MGNKTSYKKSNSKKSEQLGMPHGTAHHRLNKLVMFDLLRRHNENICFRCGQPIETGKDLSIEHKEPWLDRENAVEMFFDLNNIAFSHLSCNIGASRKRRKPAPCGYFGVYFDPTPKNHKKPWQAVYARRGAKKTIGKYTTPEEAAKAYDQFVAKHDPEIPTNRACGLLK